ncbi:MAG: DinB family protein [Deinococcota bacterium]
MSKPLQDALWQQFGASIDMLENAITDCPSYLWEAEVGTFSFWYMSYHTLFFLDYYLSHNPAEFQPPKPFTLSELNPDGELPERVYSRQELLTYLAYCRDKLREVILSVTGKENERRFVSKNKDYSLTEILIYNMRHVHHHAAQLTLALRERTAAAPQWVSRTKHALLHEPL